MVASVKESGKPGGRPPVASKPVGSPTRLEESKGTRRRATEKLPAPVAEFVKAHRSAKYPRKLLEPGWGAQLTGEEVVYIQLRLQRNAKLAYKWGFRPGQKTLLEEAIRRVAMDGDPDNRRVNVRLAQPRKQVSLAPVADLSKIRN